jgi:hypothetical protein
LTTSECSAINVAPSVAPGCRCRSSDLGAGHHLGPTFHAGKPPLSSFVADGARQVAEFCSEILAEMRTHAVSLFGSEFVRNDPTTVGQVAPRARTTAMGRVVLSSTTPDLRSGCAPGMDLRAQDGRDASAFPLHVLAAT